MKPICYLSGWIATFGIASAWIVAVCSAASPRQEAETASAVPAETVCGNAAGDEAVGEEDPQAPCGGDEQGEIDDGQDEGGDSQDEPYDSDWRPPHDTLDLLYAQLGKCTPQERALADRIKSALQSGNCGEMISACKDAAECPNPCVRAMAVISLSKMNKFGLEAEVDAVETLLEFQNDECASVLDGARDGLLTGMEFLSWNSEKAFDLGMRALDLFTPEYYDKLNDPAVNLRGIFDLKEDLARSLFAEKDKDGNPDDYERALRRIAEAASSDYAPKAKYCRDIYQKLLEEGPPTYADSRYVDDATDDEVSEREFSMSLDRDSPIPLLPPIDGDNEKGKNDDVNDAQGPLPGEDSIKEAVAEARRLYDEAAARFPDDGEAARAYIVKARKLAAEAKKRYGDTPQASKWADEELFHAAQRIERLRAESKRPRP